MSLLKAVRLVKFGSELDSYDSGSNCTIVTLMLVFVLIRATGPRA